MNLLPVEIIYRIFTKADLSTLESLSLTNKSNRSILTNQNFWICKINHDFNYTRHDIFGLKIESKLLYQLLDVVGRNFIFLNQVTLYRVGASGNPRVINYYLDMKGYPIVLTHSSIIKGALSVKNYDLSMKLFSHVYKRNSYFTRYVYLELLRY